MRLLNYTPQSYGTTSIKRNYTILACQFSDFTQPDQQLIHQEANILANKANNSAANSGKTRDLIIKKNDAYAGILAEFATMYLLNRCCPNSASRPTMTTTANQVDIFWNYLKQQWSLEVRSSFVNNGIPFSLFAVNNQTGKTYFDVLGPYYQQSYKATYEPIKDVYVRVLFPKRKYDVYNRFIKQNECFYVIGFMDGPTLINLNYHKSLQPNSSFTKHGNLTGSYYVSPMDNIIDVKKIIHNIKLKLENPFI